ncbi:MAG: carboxypeptidase regulatory-like domain-containing protein [Armatimonadota bacterium]
MHRIAPLLLFFGALVALLLAGGPTRAAGPDALIGSGGGELAPRRDVCVSPAERLLAERQAAEFVRRYGKLRALDHGSLPKYPFHPQAGTLWQDLFGNNFVDLDPSSGILDWDGTNFTYDGHQGHDVDLKSFGEQEIGVPIFAALDGQVTAVHDGEPDQNTTAPNVPANYVVLHHGGTHFTMYWHLKRGSVAVALGQMVKAGTQLGLTASSGFSTGPHLHFESRHNNTWYEPYAGPSRPGESYWVSQVPIRRELYLRDLNITAVNPADYPGLPFDMPRSGTFTAGTRTVAFWAVVQNLPAFSTWRVRFLRPNGTVRYDSGTQSRNNNTAYRGSWWWWRYSLDLDTAGSWTLELTMNGTLVTQVPLTVIAAGASPVNRAPFSAASAAFDPPRPAPSQVVFCRVNAPLVRDDPDYDIVRFRYQWTVNGATVRDVTSAALSDAIPHGLFQWGDLLRCQVTPTDGSLSASSLSVETRAGYQVSGRVTAGGSPLSGVTISADGRSTITAADGTYSFSGLAPAIYELTASRAGYRFAPESRLVSVGPDQTGQDFVGTPAYRIGGTVTLDGAGLSGVTVEAGGETATTGADGAYLLPPLPAGTYTVTASKTEYTFSPASHQVIVGPDASAIDFSAQRVTYRITGRIRAGGAGLAGVSVTAGGSTVLTDAAGDYALEGLVAGSYTVTPSRQGYLFEPPSRSVALGPEKTGQDFTAVEAAALATFTLRPGKVKGGKPLKGTVTLTRSAIDTATLTITSDNPAVFGVTSVQVPPGQTKASFKLRTRRVRKPVTVTVSAQLSSVTLQQAVKIRR